MIRRTIALFACMILWGISVPSHAAEISGAWKIATRGGPTPICSFVQVGNNLNGSCIGLQATGTVTGTVVGPTVRWRWRWATYGKNTAAAFDFIGSLQANNTITGTVERREIGLSLNFTAQRETVKPGAPPADDPVLAGWLAFCKPTERVDDYGMTRLSYAHAGCEYGPGNVPDGTRFSKCCAWTMIRISSSKLHTLSTS